jgi:hypothetical protein
LLSSSGKLKLAGLGSRERKKEKGGAGYEVDSCFMALDVSEKYQNVWSWHDHCNVSGVFAQVAVAESHTLARRIPTPCYPHSFKIFLISITQNYT